MQAEVKPLSGIKILDLTSYIAGPYCTLLLSAFGAEVVKVESPLGDESRTWPPIKDGFSGYFANFHGGKKSFSLDLKQPESREVLNKLISKCDVFIHNYTGKTRRKLDMGYDTVARLNPNVIYCNISGFGASGPYEDRKGFDTIFQAMSGVTWLTGEKGGSPIKAGVPIGDVSGGLFAALSVMAAVHKRSLTGKGEYIDMALVDGLVNFLPVALSFYSFTGKSPARLGSQHPGRVPSATFLCADGKYVHISVTDGQWGRLCDILGIPEWREDEFYKLNNNRVKAREEVMAKISAAIGNFERADLVKQCMEQGIPCGEVFSIDEIENDPQIQFRNTIDKVQQDNGLLVRYANYPAKFKEMDVSLDRNVPKVGQHNEEVLKNWLGE